MIHSPTLNNKIDHLHEIALTIASADLKSSFNELLQNNKSFTIHHRNIHSLSIEIFTNFWTGLLQIQWIMILSQTKGFLMNLETVIHFEVGESTLWNTVQKQYHFLHLKFGLLFLKQ